jgi:lipopolysaccharide export LptBFGC system permease protein LptF
MDILPVPRQPLGIGPSQPWIKILHLQVLHELLGLFVLTLSVMTGLMLLVGAVQQLVALGASADLLLKLIPYLVPVMLPFAIPGALLFAVVMVYGRMGADGEITAAKAAGINVVSLLAPGILLGAELALATFVLTDRAVPWAAQNIQTTVMAYAGELMVQQLDAKGHLENGPCGMQVVVAGMDGTWMIRPKIDFRAPDGREYSVWAAGGRFEIDCEQGAVRLTVEDANVDVVRGPGGPHDRVFISGTQTIQLPYLANAPRPKSRHLTLAEIRRRIPERKQFIRQRARELTHSGAGKPAIETLMTDWYLEEAILVSRSLQTELHSRYALAYASFGFALFGSALAALQASGRMLANILFCFMPIAGAYYTVELGIAAQCKAGHLDPAWAMWIGNVLLTGLALWLIRAVARR